MTEPLVSILVITYNSSRYILETLNSIYAQSYQNIELIVSDDCSSDNTVAICEKWGQVYGNRFHRVKVVSSENNSGVCANCNQGLRHTKGVWVKILAGDDLLYDSCIASFINAVNRDKNIFFIFSWVQCISESGCNISHPTFLKHPGFFELDAEHQYQQLLINNRVFAPASFISRSALDEIGGFDEQIRNIEDYPLWLRATRNGFKLHLLNETLVKYRVHWSSITNSSNNFIKDDLKALFQRYKIRNVNLRNVIYLYDEFIYIYTLGLRWSPLPRLLSPLYFYRSLREVF